MTILIYLLYIFPVAIVLLALYTIIIYGDEKEKLKKSLEDEFIIDPDTGTKLTLEQAESGHWISHNTESYIIPEKQIEKLETEEQKDGNRAINYLKEQKEYNSQKLNKEEIQILEKTKTLSKYDDWTYSDCFSFQNANGFVFLPAVKINDRMSTNYLDTSYDESQVMFWLKLKVDLGHYYLREKAIVERLFDLIKNNDALKLKNYKSFVFKKSTNLITVIRILNEFENYRKLEIEFMGTNLFIKNRKLVNQKDIKRIENIIKNIC